MRTGWSIWSTRARGRTEHMKAKEVPTPDVAQLIANGAYEVVHSTTGICAKCAQKVEHCRCLCGQPKAKELPSDATQRMAKIMGCEFVSTENHKRVEAKELPLETVERVGQIIEDKLFPIFGAGPYEATARDVVAAIASMGGLREALEWALDNAGTDHPHYPERSEHGGWQYPYLIHGTPSGGGVGHAQFDTALEAVNAARTSLGTDGSPQPKGNN